MASKPKPEEPAEFNWLSLSQPTPPDDTPWEVVKTAPADTGPWWVEGENGGKFATPVLLKGMKRLDESPFDRSGNLRSPIPGGTDTASAD